jgi:DNA adenine methylase
VGRVDWTQIVTSDSFPRPIAPVRTPAAYIGGKKQLSKRLCSLIDATPHGLYAEAFVGMGGVFLKRTLQPRGEVINDFNGELATFFRILQRHYVPFIEMLRYQLTSRREFERLKASDPTTLTDLERAARFLYLQRTAFGGKVAGQNFGVPYGPGRFNVTKLVPMLEDVHERLAGVVIENLPWQAFVDRYDRPETLFYLDPPYWGSEGDYGRELFARDQFAELAGRLGTLKGRFILSINDVPEIRELFAGFALEAVGLDYTLAGGKPVKAEELIITGGSFGKK